MYVTYIKHSDIIIYVELIILLYWFELDTDNFENSQKYLAFFQKQYFLRFKNADVSNVRIIRPKSSVNVKIINITKKATSLLINGFSVS